MTKGSWWLRAETVIGFIIDGINTQPDDHVEVNRGGNIYVGTVC